MILQKKITAIGGGGGDAVCSSHLIPGVPMPSVNKILCNSSKYSNIESSHQFLTNLSNHLFPRKNLSPKLLLILKDI